MKVLVYNERQPERGAIARMLERLTHTVHLVSDKADLLAALTQYEPDVAFLAWRAACDVSTVHSVRATCPRTFIVALVDSGAEIASLLAAGAHDVLRRPIVAEELNARLGAPQRYHDWVCAMEGVAGPDVGALCAWRTLGDLVATDIGDMVCVTLVPIEVWPTALVGGHVATIPMSLAAHKLELRISIAADARGMAWLGEILLGGPTSDGEALADVLRELANTAGGALKRAALLEQVTFTTGLPVHNATIAPPNGDNVRGWVLTAAQGFVGVHAELRNRENRRVAASSLSEGMVLVSDLRTGEGALLVVAGTRLTATTAEHVARILGERFVVEVAA